MIIVVNYSAPHETELVQKLVDRFGKSLRVVTDGKQFELNDATYWIFPDMKKGTVEWTRRILKRFLTDESDDTLVKIDPDTDIQECPIIPGTAEVVGDFRKSDVGNLFLGAFQHFTRAAVEKILLDKEYIGKCVYQDVALANCIDRLNLLAYNSEDIDGWWFDDMKKCAVVHKGKFKPVPRHEFGFLLKFSKEGLIKT